MQHKRDNDEHQARARKRRTEQAQAAVNDNKQAARRYERGAQAKFEACRCLREREKQARNHIYCKAGQNGNNKAREQQR